LDDKTIAWARLIAVLLDGAGGGMLTWLISGVEHELECPLTNG
jgi:hypothetical protein